jgi:hypothetical protein
MTHELIPVIGIYNTYLLLGYNPQTINYLINNVTIQS